MAPSGSPPILAFVVLVAAARAQLPKRRLSAALADSKCAAGTRTTAAKLAAAVSVWPQPRDFECDASRFQTFLGPERAAPTFRPELATLPPQLQETIRESVLPDIFVHSYLKTGRGPRLTSAAEAPAGEFPAPLIVLNIKNPEAKVAFGIDESYELLLQERTWTIKAGTQVGALYALESLRQLVQPVVSRSPTYIAPLSCTIRDSPRFPHRGLLLDVGRHFQFPAFITQDLLPAMRMNKLNVLHLHLTEDQSFPIESESFPELAQKAAFSPLEVYPKNTMRAIVEEAELHGIRVIPEFDMPGHSTSLRASHPELFACTPEQSARGAYDPTKEEVYAFLRQLLDEYRSSVFSDSFVHLGTDEVPTECWQKTLPDHDPNTLFNTFINRVGGEVLYQGQTPVMWDEALFTAASVSPPQGSVVQIWRNWTASRDPVRESVKRGYRTLFSLDSAAHANWYLDIATRWEDRMYTAEPVPANLTAAEEALILGGEGAMWGEHVDGSDLMSTVFPRLSAIAERLWSPRAATRDPKQALPRLRKFRCMMLQAGIGAEPLGGTGRQAPLGPGSCLQISHNVSEEGCAHDVVATEQPEQVIA
mmetsp:Transcript_40155/g.115914  ORF Transcript_40155/g.115914 Transcript_40155/m.115914 type:complete len:591 (+) Transcript_40155:42-1814(+)